MKEVPSSACHEAAFVAQVGSLVQEIKMLVTGRTSSISKSPQGCGGCMSFGSHIGSGNLSRAPACELSSDETGSLDSFEEQYALQKAAVPFA